MLQELADDESDITHVVLKTSEGKILGEASNQHLFTPLPEAGEDTEFRVPIPGTDEELVARATLKSLHAVVGKLRAELAGILALVFALALAVSFWASRLLSSKVRGLRGAMDDIMASGDFSRPLPVAARGDASDEIESLAGHFNELAGRMRETEKTEARAAVAAQVAHDIRSPLTAMTLALNQLQTALQGEERVRAAVSGMLSALSNGVSRVGGIVNRLSGRKAEQGANVEAPRLTLVDKLLFDVAQEHALRFPRSLRFSVAGFEPVPGVWSVVQVTELQAALSNLLNNACEAVGEGGRVELFSALEGRALRVTVRDEGVGIPPENLARVFEREFTAGKKGGSGLGLYQAKKAIEWSGGKIEIQSTPGKGTTVSFTLPVEKAPGWMTDEITLEKGQSLVVADDDPAVLAAWRRKAESAGVPVREFSSIRAVEEALRELGGAAGKCFVLDQYAEDGRAGLTGLAFIEAHGLGPCAALCTSEFDDPAIQARVKAAKAKLIPKPRLEAVRVVVRS
jgi:signal transduction histidine kinase